MSIRPHRTKSQESGAILVLALVFLFAVAVVTLALAGFAVGAESNTSNLRAESTLSANAQSAASVAVQGVRTTYDYNPQGTPLGYNEADANTDPAICSPDWVESETGFRVYCVGFWNKGNTLDTRTVDFYVCAKTVSFGSCTGCPVGAECSQQSVTPSRSVALFAEADYSDVPPGQPSSAAACVGAASPSTCGLYVSLASWDLRLAD
jgi:hypothetical protein